MSDTLAGEEERGSAAERVAAELANQRREDIPRLLIDALKLRFGEGPEVSIVLVEARALSRLQGD